MKILLLPLDSRPCTYDFAYELGCSAGAQVIRPDRKIMDFYLRSSNFPIIREWLLENEKGCDKAIISLDQLAYGGLISSRKMEVPEKEAVERLDVLRQLHTQNPQMEIMAFNTILRTTITMKNEKDRIWWEKVHAYSLAFEDEKKRKEYEKEIPDGILKEYLAVRKRNHAVNLEAIRLAEEGILKEVLLLQEDSGTTGIHHLEQKDIINQIRDGKLEKKVHLTCGTDEGGIALMGKAIHQSRKKIHIEWLDGTGACVARYEDRPFRENLKAYMDAMDMEECEEKETDTLLVIDLPRENEIQKDLALEPEKKEKTPGAEKACIRMKEWVKRKRVAYLDIRDSNGGNSNRMEAFGKEGLLSSLYAYAGWNTACNSLGTILGEILCEPKDRRFRNERYLDDWLYQGEVRKDFKKKLMEEGEDPWNIRDTRKADILLNRFMHEHPSLNLLPLREEFTTKLVWPRVFETKTVCRKEG